MKIKCFHYLQFFELIILEDVIISKERERERERNRERAIV